MAAPRTLGFDVTCTWTEHEHGVALERMDTWRHNERRTYSTDAVREFAAFLTEAANRADAKREERQAFLQELNRR